ncbi:MAG: hypothetical protein J5644_05260 [Bacteroidales bacterium]|nr:hypothetical protein [Bacteroidales bacterium]
MEHLKTKTAKELMKHLRELLDFAERIKNLFIAIKFKDTWESYIIIHFVCASENRGKRIFSAKISAGDRQWSNIDHEYVSGLHNFGGVCDCICDNVDSFILEKNNWHNPFIEDCTAEVSTDIKLTTLSI